MKPDDHSAPGDLDDLLGLDPDPRLSAASREALRAGLGRARDEARLDRVLGHDRVEVPPGLAERVLGAPELVAARRRASLDRANRSRAFPLQRVAVAAVAALAAAAALFLVVLPREDAHVPAGTAESAVAVAPSEAPPGDPGEGALTSWEEPSDELLAALSVLESMDVLTEDLDPFEADVMLLFDADELLMLELLEGGVSEAEESESGAPASGGKKKG